MTDTRDRPAARRGGIAKAYGAVVALRDASLAVRPGEVHALMGANGAGKSTFVKILTGAVRPDRGHIRYEAAKRSQLPAEARRRDRLGLPGAVAHPGPRAALEPAADRDAGRRVPSLAERAGPPAARSLDACPRRAARLAAHRRPGARPGDRAGRPAARRDDRSAPCRPHRARARRRRPPAGRQGLASIFISHRMIEIAAICDRATVLREGATVGVVDVTAGSEERIVELMLGKVVELAARPAAPRQAVDRGRGRHPAARRQAASPSGHGAEDVSFDVYRARSWAWSRSKARARTSCSTSSPVAIRPSSGEVLVDGSPASFGHPADAIRAGSSTSRPTGPRRC